jgi:hypothetical protein
MRHLKICAAALVCCALSSLARAEDITKTLHTPYGDARTVLDQSTYDHAIDMCVNGRSSAGFMAGYFERDEATCSSLSDSIVLHNKDPIHMQIAAWYGRQDCDQWHDTARCILGTLRPLINYPGLFAPVQDVVALAKDACKGLLSDTTRYACGFAGKYFLAHGEPLVADEILQNTCYSWFISHGGPSCEEAGAPEEVAKRKAEAGRLQAARDAVEEDRQRQQAAAEAHLLSTPEGQAQLEQRRSCVNQCGAQATSCISTCRTINGGPMFNNAGMHQCTTACLQDQQGCNNTCVQTYGKSY